MKKQQDKRNKGSQITNLDEIKQIEIDILDEIVQICSENNLKYILAYGTLLGAVRHKGFIPWDDDIDIIMPRYDYNKLLEIWNDGKYRLVECMKNKDYIYPFAKVYDADTILEESGVTVSYPLGIYVDIFPCDAIKDTPEKEKKYLNQCEMVEKMRMYSLNPFEMFLNKDPKKNFGRKIIWNILRKIGPAKFSRILTKKLQKYSFSDAEYAGCICNRNLEREMLPKKVFEDLIDLEFEGKLYKAPNNYHLMLQKKYGDYMALPPVEERVLKHGFKAWKCMER